MNIDNIKLFFQPAYLLNPYPGYEMKYLAFFLVFFGLLIVASLIIFIIAKKNKKNKPLFKYILSIFNWLIWVGVVGLFLLFMRYEGIPYISIRFILLAWLATFIVWGISILFFGYNKYLKSVKEFKKEQERKKYLTRKRK